ncbi:MAG TPA: queuosine precursor transporter [Candidatus Rifleibacterium sp.]|nr:queuosine precursor transporter [Candidatus Rifleibacterium sp.]HPT47080.1 queuosine precursor transporter [Candidatus Rifleibacterium sp.]
MTNNYIWVILLITNYFLLTLSFRLFRLPGLFAWVALSSVLANIQVVKTVELFGLVTTLGNIVYGTSFLATDIISECYSKEEAHKAVKIGMFSLVATTIIMQICLWFAPHASDIAHGALSTIFSIMPRIAMASLTAYCVSQNFDVWFYHYLWRKFPDRLWVRNNGSTMTSQLIDNIIFTFLAFYGVFESNILLQVFTSTYLLKWIVALCDTPVIYWARSFHRRNPEGGHPDQGSNMSATACASSLPESARG